jgi:hypothetical protein
MGLCCRHLTRMDTCRIQIVCMYIRGIKRASKDYRRLSCMELGTLQIVCMHVPCVIYKSMCVQYTHARARTCTHMGSEYTSSKISRDSEIALHTVINCINVQDLFAYISTYVHMHIYIHIHRTSTCIRIMALFAGTRRSSQRLSRRVS